MSEPAIPAPQDSVASLLEQILAVMNDSLSVQKQILAANESLLSTATESNNTLALLLESSQRIEKLLGGGEEVSVPAMLKVVYKFVISQGAKDA